MSDPGLGFVKAFIAARAKLPPAPDRIQFPATVQSYDTPSNIATVRIAGDSSDTDATSLVGALTAAQRVMVAFDKPQGISVVAVAP